MPRIAFLFPGQGAQYVGMGRQLRETVPAAAKLFTDASQILGYDLAEVCASGPAEKLNATAVSQPAIFVTSLAALELLRAGQSQILKECNATAGLSLGEYTALVFAGAMSFEDGLRVVMRRGEAMQRASDTTPSAMVSILGLDLPKVEEICAAAGAGETLQVANLLCPGNIVVSGTKKACEAVEKLASDVGGRTVRLAVAGAFHTQLMKPADEELAEVLSGVTVHSPNVPVWSNVDGQPHSHPDKIRELLVCQVLKPVLWEQTMRNLLESGCDKFYEIGPGRVLAGLLKRVQRKVECQNIAG